MPVGPIKFEEVFAERIGLSWKPPTDDGGSKITNYVVEKREENRKTWVHVSSDPKECQYVVQRLTEGHEYEFRVMAQNKYGIGPPLYSAPEKARNLFSECPSQMISAQTFLFEYLFNSPLPLTAVPGQCEKPTVTDVSLESMTVNWEEPEYDGGSPVTGYWLERKETTGKRWARVNRDPIRIRPMGVSHIVTGLMEGAIYQFRVIAMNAAGCGLPSMPSDPAVCRDPIGMLNMTFFSNPCGEFILYVSIMLVLFLNSTSRTSNSKSNGLYQVNC